MRLTKTITIGGTRYPLNTGEIHLGLFNPGRAVFDVVADATLSGLVIFSAGYDPQKMHQVFYGWVENCFAIDKKQQRIFCRELSAVLSRLVPVSLRNVTLPEVLAAIATDTGLGFVTPDADYTKTKAPAFYSLGSGYGCMQAMARVYTIKKYIWQQQGDGKIFVGSWDNSYWAGRQVDLPVDFMARCGLANSATIPVTPQLRPGVQLQGGQYITRVNWVGDDMQVEWDVNPWGTRWTNRLSV